MGDLSDASREELEAALAARRELGREYEPALVASFVDKIDRSIAERVEQQVAERDHGLKRLHQVDEGARIRQFVLGLVSMGTGVPITLFASGMGGGHVGGVAVAWLGIVGVNVAHAWSLRRPS